jgi:hypothetical protein
LGNLVAQALHSLKKTANSSGQYTINPGGDFLIYGGGIFDSELPLLNNGGTFKIKAAESNNAIETTAIFPVPFANDQDTSIRMISGKIEMSRFTNLSANGIKLENGKLATVYTSRTGYSLPTITTPKLTNLGAVFSLLDDLNNRKVGNNLKFETLKIDGEVIWSGGSHSPYMESLNGNNRDLLWSTGKFTVIPGINSNIVITPTVINSNGEEVTSQNGDGAWSIIESDTLVDLNLENLPEIVSVWLSFYQQLYVETTNKKFYLRTV